jgi:ribosome-binding protein aMBF1 (putative translation factor)
MSRFFKLLDKEYSVVDFAKNLNSFDHIKHGVYLWYYPIRIKHKKRNIDSALDLFYSSDFQNYNLANELFIEDKTRHLKSITVGTEFENPKSNILNFTSNNSEEKVSEVISELFMSLSISNRPLYIGKSSPRNEESQRTLSNRIQEHINGRSDFGISIKELSTGLNIKEFIVKVIDLGKVDKDFFNGEFSENKQDLANFVEIHLINLFKPSFNILYK